MPSKTTYDPTIIMPIDDQIQTVLKPEKERGFTETVEMQCYLKNMPKNAKVALNSPLPFTIKTIKPLVIGNQADVDAAKKMDIATITFNEVQGMKTKNQKTVKNLIKKHDYILVSQEIVSKIPKLIGPIMSRQGKFAQTIMGTVEEAIKDLDKRLKMAQKKSLCLSGKIGNLKMSDRELKSNIVDTLQNILNNVPKGWDSIKSVTIKSTMGRSQVLFGTVKKTKNLKSKEKVKKRVAKRAAAKKQ